MNEPFGFKGGFVYMRDASWCNRPGRAGRYYFAGKDCASACGRVRVLNDYEPELPRRVDKVLRCRKLGCREQWEKAMKDAV